MDPDLQRVQDNVRRMIDQGAPKEHIDRYLSDEGYTNEPGVGISRVAPPRPDLMDRDHMGPAAGRLMLQGLSLQTADEVLRDDEQLRQYRQDNPVLAGATEILGGAAAPVGAAVGTTARVANPVMRLLAGMGVGGAIGAAEGAAASEGTLLERLANPNTPIGLAAGMVSGGLGSGGAARRAGTERARTLGARLNESFEEATGVRQQTGRAFRSEIDDARQQLNAVYGTLDDAMPGAMGPVPDEQLSRLLDEFQGKYPSMMSAPGGARTPGIQPNTTPSFEQLRELRAAMASSGDAVMRADATRLTREMDRLLAPSMADNVWAANFSELNTARGVTEGLSDAFRAGYSKPLRSELVINEELRRRGVRVGSEAVQRAVRAGRLANIMEKISKGEKSAVSVLKRFAEAEGSYADNVIRPLFGGNDEAMDVFMRFVQTETDAARIDTAFRVLTNRVGQGLAATGAAGAAYQMTRR